MADMVLVVAELQDGSVKKITHELITAAREVAEDLDYEVGVVALGEGLDEGHLAADLGARGADVLFLIDGEPFADYSVEPYAAALQQLIEEEEPEAILFGMTPAGSDLAPRVAAKVETGMASDITGLTVEDGELIITRPMYSGQVIARMKVNRSPIIATLRANTWAPAQPERDEEAEVETVEVDEVPEPRLKVVSADTRGGDRPDLAEAPTVVSGGRGVQSPENFTIIENFADLLGAAVGTTRAVVDAGWRPYEEQVGQTGKTISPQLYFAIGISGALQHLSGMRTSQYIVAINKDPDAPIFKIADYGIVADLFEVVPALETAIKQTE